MLIGKMEGIHLQGCTNSSGPGPEPTRRDPDLRDSSAVQGGREGLWSRKMERLGLGQLKPSFLGHGVPEPSGDLISLRSLVPKYPNCDFVRVKWG